MKMTYHSAFIILVALFLSGCKTSESPSSEQDFRSRYINQMVSEVQRFSSAIYLSQQDLKNQNEAVQIKLLQGYVENLYGLIEMRNHGLGDDSIFKVCRAIQVTEGIDPSVGPNKQEIVKINGVATKAFGCKDSSRKD